MAIESCVVCGNAFEMGEVFELTAAERDAIGPAAPLTVAYCNSCLRVMRNRQQGAQLLKGVFEGNLREVGVQNAKERAEEFHKKLLSAATKKLQ